MITILEAATMAGVTKDKCRYWLKLLDLEMVKQNGKLYLPGEAVNFLAAMKKAVESGLSPVAAAVEVKSLHALPVESTAPICNQDNHTAEKIADLQNAVMLLAATVEKQTKVIEQQGAIIARQNSRLDLIACKLLPQPGKPVNVWQPENKPAPKVSWLKRAWLELINPVALRATP